MATIHDHTRDQFYGTLDDYDIHIERRNDDGLFYIVVYAPDGRLSYDGYWEKEGASMDDAIAEAMIGAGMVFVIEGDTAVCDICQFEWEIVPGETTEDGVIRCPKCRVSKHGRPVEWNHIKTMWEEA